MANYLFTSESVTEGHPDKICDKISDSILDAILEQDPDSHVACECCCTTGLIFIMGEISTSCYVDIPKIVRDAVREIGYTDSEMGFDASTCAVLTAIDEQSSDIAMGVNKALENKLNEEAELQNGAGDQGMMFGYACDETPVLMPLPIYLAHKMAKKLSEVRKNGSFPYLLPDGKTQVTVEYDGNGEPLRVDTVVLSIQHRESVSLEQIRKDMIEHVILPCIPEKLKNDKIKFFINPTGRFVKGGPAADSGLTGRKIIVDTYGGSAPHGGGAFSGKDPSKVDRSASYAARWIAKNIVAAGLCSRCQVQIAYAIGVANPVSINVTSFGTGKVSDFELERAVKKIFDLRPTAIIKSLGLKAPIYAQTATYGHFGRPDLDLPWERCNRTEELLAALNL